MNGIFTDRGTCLSLSVVSPSLSLASTRIPTRIPSQLGWTRDTTPYCPVGVTEAASKSSIESSVTIKTHISSPSVLIKSGRRSRSHLSVSESDRVITDAGENSKSTETVTSDSNIQASEASNGSSATVEQENKVSSSPQAQSVSKRAPLTARERLRAARVMSRYSDSKPAKSEMGRSVLDAVRESEKGKKGLPEAPTNLFDDSKRGMPKAGLTFNFPGGFDLFVIAFSFVFISTVMFATTYIVWKVGAIHFNEY